MDKRLILVDGSSHVFRAYYALQRTGFSSPSGKPTHVLYGVLNMMKALRKQHPDSTIIIVFDGKGKGIRAEWYPKYKAQRPPTPQDMKEQFPPLFEALRAEGIPLVQEGEWEADDIIGTLAQQAPSLYEQTYIATRDKDLAQLVSDKVLILADEKENILWGPAEVKQKFGVAPQRIADYLALVGDAVDNIPGVEKVGPKTAAQLLEKYGSLEKLVENVAEVPGKVGENLLAATGNLALNKKLTTIITDVSPLPHLASLKHTKPDKKKLEALYLEYGMRSFLKEMESGPSSPTDYHLVLSAQEWQDLLRLLKKSACFSLELMTEKPQQSALVGLAFSLSEKKSYYVPCNHSFLEAPKQLEYKDIIADLLPLFADRKKTLVGHNLKHLFHILGNQEKEKEWDKLAAQLPQQWEDTMLLSYVVNSTASQHHSLTDLCQLYLGKTKKSYEELVGKGKNKLSFDQVELEQARDHAAENADISLQLLRELTTEMKKEQKPRAVYAKIEKPLMLLLLRMERDGALLDSGKLRAQSRELEKEMEKTAQQVFSHSKNEFNLNSPAQLNKILYEEMGFEVTRKTAGGKPSTAEDVLQELAIQNEFPRLILKYRGLSKLKNTYTDPLPQLINPQTGRVHTSFHQAGAATGRLASLHPNLQNIPIKTAAGRRIRQAFIAPPGSLIASADYSQIELRIMAHLSKDKTLLKAFENKQDIHRVTAAEVFGIKPEQVDDEKRRLAKTINFGLIYGMSAFGLARQLQIEQKTAQEFIIIYFERYPGVQDYMQKTRASAHKNGWVETLSGRRIYTRDINSSNHAARQAAERAAINAPVQGTAADIIKLAMLEVDRKLDHKRAKLILQVHDELLLEVDENYIKECEKLVRSCMTAVSPLQEKLQLPLDVDFGYGANWDQAH